MPTKKKEPEAALVESPSVEADHDAREIVVTVGDSHARLGVDDALTFRRQVEQAYLEVA